MIDPSLFKFISRKLYVSVLVVFFTCHAVSAQTTLTNPILAGFYPDPSIVKVASDYYLINSTFSYFPGLPVFHSKDLKNWKQVGNVINRPGQMNFLGDRMTAGLFAPSISYNKGTYYVVCTWSGHKGNFVVTAKNPAGPWSDPVWLTEVKGIDPSLFFDDDKAYIIYNSDPPNNNPLYSGHRTIRQYQFNPEKLRVTGEEKILVNGGVDISKKPVWIEGPHIIKANHHYYLYAAEGGTGLNHSEVVLRSDKPTGPFMPYAGNPILTQRNLPADRKDPITSTGHAQFVEGPDGNTYAVFLAVRPYPDDYYNTGRETFIAPVKWIDGWPVINPDHKEVLYSYQTTYPEVKQKDALPQSGNFSYTLTFKEHLDPNLLFMRTLDTTWFNLSPDKGLTMRLRPETIMEYQNPSFIGKRQQHMYCTVETALSFSANTENEKAGLSIFQNEQHFYYICRSIDKGKAVVQLFKSKAEGADMELLSQALIPNSSPQLFLKIKAKGDSYSFYFAEKKDPWTLLKGNLDARFLSTYEAKGFTGCVFGMYATSSGTPSTNYASFNWLKYTGNDPMYK